jgi:hypothetical protein
MGHARANRVQPPTQNDDARGEDPVPAMGTVALVSGIVEDARDLFAAHVEALRDDMSARLATLGATIGSMLIAIGVFVITGLLLCLAVAASLIALGAAPWIALWIVTVLAAAVGVGFVLRARTKARAAGQSVTEAAERARSDVTTISGATAAPVTSPPPERRSA